MQVLAGINTALLAVISLSLLDLRSRVVRLENMFLKGNGKQKGD